MCCDAVEAAEYINILAFCLKVVFCLFVCALFNKIYVLDSSIYI
ncbi:hypothetical protein M5D96_005692 [Drosophila gunungcola]|uniref:Uncharacterized protein n=1 Tax=Drosophila gunungcola TaxID=103775 RepID=A0A9P9YQU2_9MUSC|nr:hypothetical protein M5D96_005692 [Drosophila gunungcola]